MQTVVDDTVHHLTSDTVLVCEGLQGLGAGGIPRADVEDLFIAQFRHDHALQLTEAGSIPPTAVRSSACSILLSISSASGPWITSNGGPPLRRMMASAKSLCGNLTIRETNKSPALRRPNTPSG